MKQDPSTGRQKNAVNGAGIHRIIKATQCSILGLKAAFRHEAAFRQELVCSLILLPVAVYISQSLVDFVSLVAVMLLVLIVELVNSAIESVVDRIGYERHELSGRAKDLGSAAVSLALFVAALVWFAQLYQFFTG
jgi:diacylglycerol kinase (ATP)